MDGLLTNIGLAFQQGLAQNQTSHIFPVSLIILAGSLDGTNKRPLAVAFGFVITFVCFTLFSRLLVENTSLDLDIYRLCAFTLIGLFGVLMFSDYLHAKFNHLIHIFVGVSEKSLIAQRNSISIGVLLGVLLAIAWTPGGSSQLDAVIVQTIIQKITVNDFIILFAFAIGVILPTLLIIILLRALFAKNTRLTQSSHVIHQFCGVIIFISILFTGYYYTYTAPLFTVDKNGELAYQETIRDGVSTPYPMPDISGITAWINSAPLTKNDLHSKVVLLYFWTYSCIHCSHALPYIINWYNNYRDNGLLIIGVHAPEFDFEKNLQNVEHAVVNFKIPFPIAIDNNFVTWKNFHNKNWPAYYLIDKKGNVVYEHVGEGEYTIMENNIRFLLGFNTIAYENVENEHSPLLTAGITPETHFGSEHIKTYAGSTPLDKNNIKDYAFPTTLMESAWALSGKWSVSANNITAASNNAAVKIRFHSKQVFAIMGFHSNHKMAVKVLLDGKPITNGAGNAVTNSSIDVDSPRLYEILSLDKPMSGELQLIAPKGLELYTFSFDDQ
ncbi:MAG: redoxin domain-containing protein [Pseudomonadota bacterium]